MSYAVVMEFQNEFETINLDMMKNDTKNYDMAILVAYTLETKRGFIVKKQGKTTRKGTKFTYKACKMKKKPKSIVLNVISYCSNTMKNIILITVGSVYIVN